MHTIYHNDFKKPGNRVRLPAKSILLWSRRGSQKDFAEVRHGPRRLWEGDGTMPDTRPNSFVAEGKALAVGGSMVTFNRAQGVFPEGLDQSSTNCR